MTMFSKCSYKTAVQIQSKEIKKKSFNEVTRANQKFCNILEHARLGVCVYHMIIVST